MYNAWYKFNGSQLMIGKKTKKGIDYIKSDLPPYCYVEAKHKNVVSGDVEPSDRNTLNGERVVRVSFRKPQEVKRFREFMKKKKISVYEADIPYIRRYMIDKNLTVNEDYRKLYYDIETDSDGNLISIGVMGNDDKSEWLHGSENVIISDFLDVAKKYDMMLGWNNCGDGYRNKGFDRPILDRVAKVNNLNNNMNVLIELDVYEMYKKGKSSPSYELGYVGNKELGIEKLKIQFGGNYTKSELEKYNMRDVELTKGIDEKLGLSDTRIEIANICSVFPNEAMGAIVPIDSLILKKASELKIALPCSKKGSSKWYRGADIFSPVIGRHEKVAVFDFESLYPNIIIIERISPDSERKILPESVKFIMDREKVCKQKYKETGDISWKHRREALKILRNSCYGVFANAYFRLYDEDIPGEVTRVGREQINLLRTNLESLPGYGVLYGDTDSVFIGVKDLKGARTLEGWLNKRLSPYKVGLDKFFSAMIFTGSSSKLGKEQGVKKRYAGYDELDNGELKIVGLEFKRSDSFDFMRRVQKRIIELILDENDEKVVERYSSKIRDKLLNGDYDDELVFSKGVKGNINDYKVEQPHVRAYRKLLERGIKPFGKVQYVVTKSGEEPVIDNKIPGNIDRNWYWDVRIKPLIKRLTSVYESKRQSKLELEN